MRRAICRVAEREHVLIDGLLVYGSGARRLYTAIVRGDAKSTRRRAAIAKVIRDRLITASRPYTY